jgi:hypothetical protein
MVVRGIPADRALKLSERVRLMAEILRAYAHARRALRRVPIAAAVASLRATMPVASDGDDVEALEEIRRLGHAVSRTLRLLPGDTRCLARSLVLTRMLADRGIPARLVIGARAGPDFLAHAWVECAGHPVLTPGDGSFGRLVEL